MPSRLDLGVKNANKMSGVDLDPSNLDAHTYLDDFFGKAKKVNENE